MVSFFIWVRELQHHVLEQSARNYAIATGYLIAFAAISSVIYYLPNYSWLEYATASNSELVLRFIGVPATITKTSTGIMLNEFVVDKPCTGIQVIATFAGILLPLPRLTWPRKILGLVLVAAGVYVANIIRIVTQLWIYYSGLFDWTAIHGPGGIVLGVISVMLLVILLDHFVPEFGDFVFSILNQGTDSSPTKSQNQ